MRIAVGPWLQITREREREREGISRFISREYLNIPTETARILQ